ncbi:sigma-54 dependent transcriptional regulator [Flavobacteriaceae bacterium]|jgi:transcriptional regulator with PAS, ATPase and Fis domain|nr:sigma-54 dependent transcriptional regulator [Flavobacteriaceae bacterium]MDA8703886.1 sigma-54 dependent transcriptional regulator [Flavobacteriaceae bacterium]MDA9276316.1 sigma-54 dependent transcriptional regulator [Flavobacteriaceae bacterium]MDB3874631.1 sigma-54 dependent transcriptional regulator [Flavobacteriaceae bacterium]MDC0479447.1 sigma-54 dependent transcriptional regulator [Flavobacteriaceae bacterium]|tara:strand:- start:97 stop:1359 length:1263 start_codon:yes stop_codon:yes gene_type:complete
MENILSVKQRFGIIGDNPKLNRAIEKSIQVANSDISVLVTGESGVGKENIPKIIHQYSHRKHSKYIAVNCGAIPDGTIDSELFGHEKGAFTGATANRSGYFEVADGGTIFLDEVGELPLATQVRLLRILENGEYIKVGSSKVEKTNVRIVAATNIKMEEAIRKGKFREDLFYRLSTIIINIPPLRNRKEDIPILFRKFASDFAQKYNMPTLRLDEPAQELLCQQEWRGNIRQLRNIAEQMSILEKERNLKTETLNHYLPNKVSKLPATLDDVKEDSSSFSSEREILYKVLFDMKNDLNDVKKLTLELMKGENSTDVKEKNQGLIEKIYGEDDPVQDSNNLDLQSDLNINVNSKDEDSFEYAETIEEEETLSLHDKEVEMIKQALIRTSGRRKNAAKELGISERTLYRKIKQHNLGDVSDI